VTFDDGDETAGEETAPEPRATRRVRLWRALTLLIGAVRDADPSQVQAALEDLGSSRRLLAPLGYVAGGFALLFDGLKLLVLNWRLTLIEALPAVWIWLTLWDLKAHFVRGKEFYIVRGPMAFVVALVVVAVAVTSFACNAIFAFAVAGPQPPRIRPAFDKMLGHRRLILGWGVGIGLAHATSTVFVARLGLIPFTVALGTVFVVMSVTFVSVPAQLIGYAKQKESVKQKVSRTAVGGALSALLTSPGLLLNRLGLLMFGVRALQIPAMIVFSIGVALQAAATSGAKAVKLGSHFGAIGPAAGADLPDQQGRPDRDVSGDATVGP